MSRFVATGTVLDRILQRTEEDVEARRQAAPLAELERRAIAHGPALSLRAVLASSDVSIIAEVKRASPSRGVFPVEVIPADVARAYIAGGASAISVLTDEPFFQGSLADLDVVAAVAHATTPPVPVLRKDFMIDPYQVTEARAHGADAILLIMAALTDEDVVTLREAARAYGMDALVEVHDEGEMARALDLGADLIGVNNRDLHTFNVDIATTGRLATMVPESVVLVGESGIFTHADIITLGATGARAALVGEGLIVQPDRAAAVRALLNRP